MRREKCSLRRATVPAAFILCILFPAVLCAAIDPRVEGILQRAAHALLDARDYAADVTFSDYQLDLRKKDAAPQFYTRTETIALQSPARYFHRSGNVPELVGIRMADGRMFYEYSGNPEEIRQQTVGSIAYMSAPGLPGAQISPFSPLLIPLNEITQWIGIEQRLQDYDRTGAGKWKSAGSLQTQYAGKELVFGALCDVIEITYPLDERAWDLARKEQPQMPDKPGVGRMRLYIGARDGLLRRAYGSYEMPGFSRTFFERTYNVKPLDPAEAFTVERVISEALKWNPGKPAPKVRPIHARTGEPPAPLAFTGADGKALTWSDFKGRVLVAQTWASWCTFCKNAFPYYEKMRRKLAGRDVTFLALNFDARPEDYTQWLRDHGGEYGFLFARANVTAENWRQELERIHGAMPAFFIVGRDGNLAAVYDSFGYGEGGEDPRLVEALRAAGVEVQ